MERRPSGVGRNARMCRAVHRCASLRRIPSCSAPTTLRSGGDLPRAATTNTSTPPRNPEGGESYLDSPGSLAILPCDLRLASPSSGDRESQEASSVRFPPARGGRNTCSCGVLFHPRRCDDRFFGWRLGFFPIVFRAICGLRSLPLIGRVRPSKRTKLLRSRDRLTFDSTGSLPSRLRPLGRRLRSPTIPGRAHQFDLPASSTVRSRPWGARSTWDEIRFEVSFGRSNLLRPSEVTIRKGWTGDATPVHSGDGAR